MVSLRISISICGIFFIDLILQKNGRKYFHCKDYRCKWTTELHFKKTEEQYKI